MNKYNSRICYKHHSQRTSMLIKFKEFIQKYWISILISWFFIWLWIAYYGDNTIVKLIVFPIISFFLVILFHLELERKNIKYLYISIKQLKKRLKIIGDIMKIYKYISIFLLYLFIYNSIYNKPLDFGIN